MSKLDSPEETTAQLENRFKVTVELTVIADCVDDAELEVRDVIQEGILALISSEEREPIYDYNITDVEPAELF